MSGITNRWLRRALLAAGASLVIGATFTVPPAGIAQGQGEQSTRTETSKLPISTVVLFSSGVGYFQRDGEVTGNAKVDLSFPTSTINDLLKSMVLQDQNGGKVGVISYDSADPIEKTLKSFTLDLTNNPSFAAILAQARGEEVEITASAGSSQPGDHKGRIVSVEKQKIPGGKDTPPVEEDILNLFTNDGLKAIPLKAVQKLRFLNPVVDSELKRALETLARGHDKQKKNVSIHFNGEGRRNVRVGYVVESPIWKTSYRLVVNPNGKALLQGWAIVENTSDEDWQGVKMSLISGRPVSFKMDLYQPLYVPRPTVEPELFASLRPQTYGGALTTSAPAPARAMARLRAGGGFGGGGLGGEGLAAPGATPMEAGNERLGKSLGLNDSNANLRKAADAALEIGQSVASAASAENLGDFFQYAIDERVNLARQKSAMLPIVNKDVEAGKVSIYNQAVYAKHPLLGLRFKNTSGMQLMQGPITVFEGANYAGDARILDLQPNEERLLSYAIDLGTEVKVEGDQKPQQLVTLKAVKGVLELTYKLQETKKFLLNNRGDQAKTVLLELPIRPGWTLKTPAEPKERSRDVYRFEVKLDAGAGKEYRVGEEMTQLQHLTLGSMDERALLHYAQQGPASDKLKEALHKAIQLRHKLSDAQRKLSENTRQTQANNADQDRLRKNLDKLPQNSAIYQDTLKKFEARYRELDKLEQDEKQLRAAVLAAQEELNTYLANLNIDGPLAGDPTPVP